MRKLILSTIVLLCTLPGMAQVKFFEGTYDDALLKSKAENKPIVVLVTMPSGCPPCAALEKSIFPTKVVGDYMNNNVLFIKYDTAEKEAAESAKKYNTTAIPTFIYLNSNGEEIMRQVGGCNSPSEFIQRVKDAIKPENNVKEMEKRSKENSSEALKYLNHLSNVYMNEKANECFKDIFTNLTDEEKLSKAWIDYYQHNITSFNTPIFEYLSENKDNVIKTMGEENYLLFMKSKSNQILMGDVQLVIYRKEYDAIKKDLAIIRKDEALQTGFSEFIGDHLELLKGGLVSDLLKVYEKAIKKAGSATRSHLTETLMMVLSNSEPVDLAEKATIIYELAIKYEDDNFKRQEYQETLGRIKKYAEEQNAIK